MLKPRSVLLASVCLFPALLAPGYVGAASASTTPPSGLELAMTGGTIQAINVTGNERIETGTIQSYMVVQPGDPFDPDRINDSLKTLYATGLFKNVTITRDGNNLDVAVVENRRATP